MRNSMQDKTDPPVNGGGWVTVAQSESLADGTAIEVLVGDQIVALFRADGTVHALDGMCAHQGGPLAQGTVSNGCVTCPWHGWQYELTTGIQMVNRQPLQRVFPVRETDGRIEIQIDPSPRA
jgi:nitrite reductase/ring-hydroxylating ferredoxin subunit